jgi:hypothetical protein
VKSTSKTKPEVIYIRGINIQKPWSQLIADGAKVIETRGYPLPEDKRGITLAIIETPGRHSKNKDLVAKIIGLIIFSEGFEYKTRSAWLREKHLHLVSADDKLYAFKDGSKKFGWKVESVVKFSKPIPAPKFKGIKYAKRCAIPKDLMKNYDASSNSSSSSTAFPTNLV